MGAPGGNRALAERGKLGRADGAADVAAAPACRPLSPLEFPSPKYSKAAATFMRKKRFIGLWRSILKRARRLALFGGIRRTSPKHMLPIG